MIEKSAGAVMVFRDKYLLLHYGAGHWGFPKGNIEKSENEKITALREMKEETGLEAELVSGFRKKINYKYKKGGELVDKTVVYFLARAKNDKVILSEEHKDHTWLPYEEARDLLTYENSKNH